MRSTVLAVLLGLVCPGVLAAQRARPLSVGGVGTQARLQRVTPGGTSELSGITLGAEGRVRWGRVFLDLAYREGSVSADSPATAPSEDLVEGRALFGIQPRPWLTVMAGAHARGTIASAGTTRWVFPQVRLRFESALGLERVLAQVELWRALSVSTNATAAGKSAAGGEASLRVRVRGAVWVRLGYSVEHAELENGALVETLEGLSFAVGIGGRH